MNKDFYTAQELADKLGVNVMTIYRYIKAKKLRRTKSVRSTALIKPSLRRSSSA